MTMTFSGKDYTGSGDFAQLDPGTYEVTLKGATMYKNNLYQSDELTEQITLIYDTGLLIETKDGKEVDALIYDAWLKFSLNEKANLVKRLSALLGPSFNPEDAEVEIDLDGISHLSDLKHWKDGRTTVTKFVVNGENVFGKSAIVTLTQNEKGYAKVTNISAPLQKRPAPKRAAPAGVPV